MTDRLTAVAARLRDAFDRSFAERLAPAADDFENLLAIRIAGDAFAVRVRDTLEISTRRRIVAVPADTPDLLGLASIRGGIVPVFGLASILGYPRGAEPRWLIVCNAEQPIALAFSELEGHVRVARAAIYIDDTVREERYVHDVVHTATEARGLLDIARVVTTIRNREGRTPAKE